MTQVNDFVKTTRAFFNIDFDQFVQITGFSSRGNYDEEKWVYFRKNPIQEFLNYDSVLQESFMSYIKKMNR